MIDFSPEDLVICILTRLHVRSSIRFRCVCKSWYTLLSNPNFIYRNLLFNYDDDVKIKIHRLLIKRRDKISKDHVFSFISYMEVEIVGSYYGLICLRIRHGSCSCCGHIFLVSLQKWICHCSVKGKDGCPAVLSLDFSSETLRTPSLPDECVISRNYDDICKNLFC
ncbi:hypothetical protein Peur_068976 [Populus x canadensis]